MANTFYYGVKIPTRCETLELQLLDAQARTQSAQRRADEYHRSNIAKDAEIRRLTAALEEAQEQTMGVVDLWENQRQSLKYYQKAEDQLTKERDEARAEAWDQWRARDYYFSRLLRTAEARQSYPIAAERNGVCRSGGSPRLFSDPQPMPKKGSA